MSAFCVLLRLRLSILLLRVAALEKGAQRLATPSGRGVIRPGAPPLPLERLQPNLIQVTRARRALPAIVWGEAHPRER